MEDKANRIPDALIGDPWIANSLMQKAIRRGDTKTAIRAASSFYALRGSAIWRRLMIIAFEDVGVGSVQTVLDTVRACTDVGFRRTHGGNAEIIRGLATALAGAPKDRSADHLIAAAAAHPDLEPARRKMASIEVAERLELVRDDELPLGVRATAAWFASGLEWDRERRILGGDIDGLADCYRTLGVPADLIEALVIAARRTREPLAVMLPLIRLSPGAADGSVQAQCMPESTPCTRDAIPLYTFDLHTRIGRQAISEFAKMELLQAIVNQHAPGRSGLDAIRLAAFHVEAAAMSPRFDWALSQSLERLGIETDLLSAGLKVEGHRPLLEAVRDSMGALNEWRLRCYEAAQNSWSSKAVSN